MIKQKAIAPTAAAAKYVKGLVAKVTNNDFALAAKPLNAAPNPVTPEVAEAAEEPMSTISSEISAIREKSPS